MIASYSAKTGISGSGWRSVFPDLHAPADGPLLEVKAARKHFGGLVAVNDLSFDIRHGEILGLIGPNGAGKSTTFALISGALSLTSGEVVFRGASIGSRPPFEVARRGIGRTFQHVKLIPTMSVLDNVALGAYLRGRTGVVKAALRLDRCRACCAALRGCRWRWAVSCCCAA